jgi:hypothetical protein
VKHPVCDNSKVLRMYRVQCGLEKPIPANIAPPRIYITPVPQPSPSP